MTIPLIAGLGTSELLIIVAVIVLLFGASKLPDLARGSGQALRIFKAETKALTDSDDEKSTDQTTAKTEPARDLDARGEVVEPERRNNPDA
ncbi:hypothetical protein GCM10011519_04810 [Marmoricola endophyticus]|uniref:Sec-independent protein translocase protein TatA n=1 Tax=Marmoricola endophyticus TaxID=2040280 RepID=A0A917BAT6_9ACTN|nr:twin-arginine translocase TatA/TatE family subunit [Marmoricola endophyticus]GGF34387.1 hypothetical protein GCM10011519_04810 [Marmoricola endophyticus]